METSDPKNIGINIHADASGVDAGINHAEKKVSELNTSLGKQGVIAGKVASQYSGLGEATQKMSGSTAAATVDVKKLDAELTALLSRINPSYAAVMKLDQGTDLLQQGMAHGLITNQQYTSSIELLESSLVRANAETGNAITMTARSRAEMVVLGREIAQGNFSRVPSTLSIIAQGLSPVALGIGAITVALAAGGYAWYKWGQDGSLASSKVLNDMKDVLEAAEEGAKKSKHFNQIEQIAEIDKEIIALEEKNNKILAELEDKKRIQRQGSQNQMLADQILYLEKTTAANQQNLENLRRNAQDISDAIAQGGRGADKTNEADPNAKLLEEARKFDQKISDQHKDAFTRDYEQWVALQNKLVAAGSKGAAARAAHEAALTIMLASESAKREAAQDEHTAKLLAKQNEKFAALHQMAVLSAASDEERVTWKLAFDLAQMDKEYVAATAGRDADAENDAAYQQARIDRAAMAEDEIAKIKKKYSGEQFKASTEAEKMISAFKSGEMKQQISTTADYLAKISSMSASRNKDMFELNKVAAIASATVNTYDAAVKAFDTAGGGWWGAAAAAATVAMGLAYVDQISSTSFGGGGPSAGGGGVPSMATSPGVPVSVQPTPTTASTVAQAPREVNIYMRGDVQLFDARTIRDQLIPALNEAAGDGVTINVRAI